ncbi:MAG: hypothetical protein ABL973_05525 [Micropepsaceae bacterium]
MLLPEPPFQGFWEFIILALVMIGWRLWGQRVRRALVAFDQKRRDADLQLLYDRANPNSHFRQSVDQINEDTTPVGAATSGGGKYTWNGETFGSREEAEAARWRDVLREARDFYKDLDRSFGNRISGRRSAHSIHTDQNDNS